jgi:response regulator RpfG family c-di-GMP phosphodiesterase
MKRLKQSSTGDSGPVRVARRPTLLVVDDEPSNVSILERIFQTEYRVLKAYNGSEALAMMRASGAEEVAAILSDQRMPGLTGVELLAKAAEERPDVARVLITGYSDMDAIIAAINLAHIMYYVSKPYEPDTIRQVVRRALDERDRRRELADRLEQLRKSNQALQEALARTERKPSGSG